MKKSAAKKSTFDMSGEDDDERLFNYERLHGNIKGNE